MTGVNLSDGINRSSNRQISRKSSMYNARLSRAAASWDRNARGSKLQSSNRQPQISDREDAVAVGKVSSCPKILFPKEHLGLEIPNFEPQLQF